MRKVAQYVSLLGILMVFGAGIFALDDYMTEDRLTVVRSEITDGLDEQSSLYDQRREDGCRRRCGFFATTADMVVSLRDGIFMSTPFDATASLPPAPEGWVQVPYNLALLEGMVGEKMRRTKVVTSTENRLLIEFDDAAGTTASDVGIYQQGNKTIVVSVQILLDGVRKAKKGEIVTAAPVNDVFVEIDGLPFRDYPQVSESSQGATVTPVAYRHVSMEIDGQVEIEVMALADDIDVQELLSGLDIGAMVESLPTVPVAYVAGSGLTRFDVPAES